MCALAAWACAAHPAERAAAGDTLRVEVSGPEQDAVRLVDTVTGATIVSDRFVGRQVERSIVSADNAVVAVRYGAPDAQSVAMYAIVWTTAAADGAKVGKVSRVLDCRPADGPLNVSLRPVPNGTVVELVAGRSPPLWHKIFLHERFADRWIEWPRALAPNDPTEGMPAAVGAADTGAPYAAWLRPLAARVP